MNRRILVVGGGASGLAAAYSAAKCGALVTLLEKKEQPGKKLSMTGNGRCNFTHKDPKEADYHSHEPDFVNRFLKDFGTGNAVGFFDDMHLLSMEKEGYYYPANQQAQSVVTALLDSLKALKVDIRCRENVESIEKKKDGLFLVKTSHGQYEAERVILSCGTEASVKDLYGYEVPRLLKKLRQPFYPYYPALTYLTGDPAVTGYEPVWSGVRQKACIQYGEIREEGEIQLTEKGISGIPVFQLSGPVIRDLAEGKKCSLRLDFLPDFKKEALAEKLVLASREPSLELGTLLMRWVPKKLSFAIIRARSLNSKTLVSSMTEKERGQLVLALKAFSYPVTGYGSLEEAQVCQGGCDLRFITDHFESKVTPGLFMTGEMLDVDGRCGGYNLHFAFGSGLLAGTQAAMGEVR